MNTRPRVIILEGPDGAGKSTLVTALESLTGYPSIHQSAPTTNESAFARCCRDIKTIVAQGKYSGTIFDRFHLSEHVYGPIARGVDTMQDTGALLEQSLWETVLPVVVLCLPPFDVAHQNWAKRNAARAEMIEKREQYEAIYRAYQTIRTTLPVVQYDYTRDRAADLYHRLKALGFTA